MNYRGVRMKINMKELQKQRREEALKAGHYARCDIVVPYVGSLNEPIMPIIEFNVNKTNPATLACLAVSLMKSAEYVLDQDKSVREAFLDIKAEGGEFNEEEEIDE